MLDSEGLYRAIRGDAAPVIIQVGGREYSSKELFPVHHPRPDTIMVRTLTAIVDYITANVDNLELGKLICHVKSPSEVFLKSSLQGSFEDRSAYICALLDQLNLPFNTWQDPETFNIWLQSCFTEQEGLAATDKGLVLKYIGSIKSVAEAALNDDGVSQSVTVKSGIASVKNAVLPNPVTLRPFRTFTEVVQPASSFVFRTRQKDGNGMEFTLIEADGGAWKNEAMLNIKAYMQEHVPGLNVIA